MAKAKPEKWKTTCLSLSIKYDSKSAYSILRSVADFSSSFSCSPNFSKCSSPRELALVFADHLRSHSSVSQPKVLWSTARDYMSKLPQATCLEESHSSFCSPFSAEFFAAATNLSLSTATRQKKVAYSM